MPGMMPAESVALESVDRYDRVDIPALDLELTIVDVLGEYFGQPGLVGVDSGDQDQRYLIATRGDSDRDGLRIEHWNGTTYRVKLHAQALEAGSGPTNAIVPESTSERVRGGQTVPLRV